MARRKASIEINAQAIRGGKTRYSIDGRPDMGAVIEDAKGKLTLEIGEGDAMEMKYIGSAFNRMLDSANS